MRMVALSSLAAAVADATDERAAHLVLADWLSERCDPGGRWLMSWLGEGPRDRRLGSPRDLHEALFAGWPHQHALVAWREGFVRELVVRLPGVTGAQVRRVLGHPTLWLVERLTFVAAQLPLFEMGMFDEMIEAIGGGAPHSRLTEVRFAGLSVDRGRQHAAREVIARVAPQLDQVVVRSDVDPTAVAWFDAVARFDDVAGGRPGPFSPTPAAPPLDADDEEALWLEHADWCDVRDDELES